MYHAYPLTAWSAIEGPILLRAFNGNKISIRMTVK